jgi:hypothetical protein
MRETAVIYAACACPDTRYLDLDGSFDLAQDKPGGAAFGSAIP